jgi:hypothetical protein
MKINLLLFALSMSVPAVFAQAQGYTYKESPIYGNSPIGPVEGYTTESKSPLSDQTYTHVQTPDGAIDTYEYKTPEFKARMSQGED